MKYMIIEEFNNNVVTKKSVCFKTLDKYVQFVINRLNMTNVDYSQDIINIKNAINNLKIKKEYCIQYGSFGKNSLYVKRIK